MVVESMFKFYDKDMNLSLEPYEFARALSDLGITDKHQQSALFHLADIDNDNTVSIAEFTKLIHDHELKSIINDGASLEFVYEMRQTFNQFDVDGDGEISWEEFYQHLSKSGYSHQQISSSWHHLDENKDSSISFAEFWKGFRAQKRAELEAVEEKRDELPRLRKPLSNVIEVDEDEKADMLGAVKLLLKKSSHKMRISQFKSKLGKVVDEEEECEFEEAAEVGLSFETAMLDEVDEDHDGEAVVYNIHRRPKDDYSDVEVEDDANL